MLNLDIVKANLKAASETAANAKPSFDAVVEAAADKVNGVALLAPVKGEKRALEKCVNDYEGDVSRLKDLVRGTILVQTAADAQAALTLLVNQGGVEVKRNWLVEEANVPSPFYRDILVYLEVQGMKCELQINTEVMSAAKCVGHKYYEKQRSIEGEIKSASDFPTEEEFLQIADLIKRQRKLYNSAWEASK